MASSHKAVKKRRRVTGGNVFQQERMRGSGFQIGTEQHKELLKRVQAEWHALSEAERSVYDRKAAEQDVERAALAQQTLTEATAEPAGKSALSSSQKKRLGQHQLNSSLRALAGHPVWQTGLALSDHISALRANLVQHLDHGDSHLDAFDYMPHMECNPAELPHMFSCCAEAHAGICKSQDRFFSAVETMCRQFQRAMEVHKLQVPVMFRVLVDTASSSSSRDGSSPTWLLLGCVGKRPLCHVFGKLVQHATVADVVTPLVEDSSWALQTLRAFLVDVAGSSVAPGVALDGVKLAWSCYKYTPIGSFPAPNHFRVRRQESLADFQVGPSVSFLTAKPQTNRVEVSLPFGIKFPQAPRAGRAKAKAGAASKTKRKAQPTAGGEEAPQEGCEAGEGLLPEDNETGPSEASVAAFVFRCMHDDNPVIPETLPEVAGHEAVAAAKSAADHHLDADIEIDTASMGGAAQAVVQAASPVIEQPPPPVRGSHFNKALGITDCAVAQRKMVCYICNMPIHKGDHRMVYAYSYKKPPRSLHPECVGQVDVGTVASSKAWLSTQLQGSRLQPGDERYAALRNAEDRLNALSGM